ncbi:MAG: YwiC-like family protein [Anaerolineales bacterium]|nr:YwiC-like family protein [Anaerolineales bacterium]
MSPVLAPRIALPQDHGSWVFLLSPLLIGIFAGGVKLPATGYLVLASLAGFLIRQPITIAVKVYSGRRARRDLPAARFWIAVYALIGLAGVLGLVAQGHIYLLYLAIPAAPVFAWHLYLVSRRAERRQAGVEIVASGVLALAAPAAFWIGQGSPNPLGWLLFILTWLQSAASIVHAYLRLAQRELPGIPNLNARLRMARRALLYTSFNLLLVVGLSIGGLLPVLLPLPYALQFCESVWGALRPAVGLKPTRIGLRQLLVSTLFTLLFILVWNL